jgi:hypothetical protein
MPKNWMGVCNCVEAPPDPRLGALGRRDFLFRFGRGVGSLALTSLLYRDEYLHAETPADPLAPKPPHFPAKAKSCIFLFMYGAPSQMDTFDPKPALAKYHGTPVTRVYGTLEKRIYVGSPFQFAKHGEAGIEVSDIFPHLATCVDDMAVIRSLHTDSENHPTGVFQMNLGVIFPGAPSMGAWVVYGLGTENQNLPAFVVLPDGGVWSGAVNWSNGYLPAIYQGTLINPTGTPIVDLEPPAGVTLDRRNAQIELLNELNRPYLDSNPDNGDLLARMKNYELAFRMQTAVPEALALEKEPPAIRELYGLDDKITQPMARKCLMARRLVERGVRFVQIYHHGWDSHENIAEEHRKRAAESDRPIAALLKDLKQRGLLSQTLVVWGGEFGRTADNSMDFFRSHPGRDHNKEAMVMWFAGGGAKGGSVVGATDELGIKAAENRYHLHDMHATMLRLLGLDDMKLTYYHAGRFKRLTDLGGCVIKEIVA